MIWALAFDGGLQPLGGGVLAVFIGVALLSPVISRPIVTVIAGGYPRVFGTVGVLARENARRNPAAHRGDRVRADDRSGPGHHHGRARPVDEVQRRRAGQAPTCKADYVVSNAVQAPFSAAIAPQIAAVPGVAAAVPFRFGAARSAAEQTFVAAFDAPAMSQVVAITVESGSLDTGDDGLAGHQRPGRQRGLAGRRHRAPSACPPARRTCRSPGSSSPASSSAPTSSFRPPRWRPAASRRWTPSSTSTGQPAPTRPRCTPGSTACSPTCPP